MNFDMPLTGAELKENLEGFTDDIHRVVIQRLGRTHELQDIAQAVRERLLQVDDKTLIDNPAAYIHRTTRNVIFDFRKRGNNGLNARADRIDAMTASELDAQPSLRVEDSSDRLSLQQEIAQALATLPVERAKVILCIKARGMSYDETAKYLGLSLGQVQHHVAEANKLLKKLHMDR
jgi:RNA polymerase sigma factor (sigma-70 family)